MEEKKITVLASPRNGTIERNSDGSIAVVSAFGMLATLGAPEEARRYAHAILELIGDPVPSKGDDTYIAVEGEPLHWISGRILGGLTNHTGDPVEAWSGVFYKGAEVYTGEFHIFRRVATVGPIPQPERKVTRYE